MNLNEGPAMEPYYVDENATLYCADALDVLRSMPSSSIDAVVTDPPYSSGGMVRGDRVSRTTMDKYVGWSTGKGETAKQMGGTYEEFTGDNRDQRGYLAWATMWMSECRRILRPGSSVLTFTDWRQLPVNTDAVQCAGLVWRGLVVWDKSVARPMKGRFRNHVEYVVWSSHGPIDGDANPVYLPSVYRHAPPTAEREHATQKPTALMRDLLQIVPPGGVVLDPFMGSGTTGVAAVLEGRKFIGVEMTEHYAEVARNRITTSINGYRPQGDQMILGGAE